MKKNIISTVTSAILAISLLLCCFSCNNINDPETVKAAGFTVNKMQVIGFRVSGLDAQYDHCVATLCNGDEEVGSAIIGDDAGSFVSGFTTIKFATPYIFKGDKETATTELTLKISNCKDVIYSVKDGELVPAELSLITSPYGTKDADLVKKYVDIVVTNDVGVFAWADEVTESLRFSYSTKELADADLLDNVGVTSTSSAKAAANAKYTITINGLDSRDNGNRYVVTGATIGSTLSNMGDNWNAWASNVADEGLISTVENGSITFTFYVSNPSWNGSNGAIKIAAIDDPAESDPWLCLLSSSSGGNINIPVDKDYNVTINAATAGITYKGAVVQDQLETINTIKVTKLDGNFDNNTIVAVCAEWIPDNVWGLTTTNKETVTDTDTVTITLSQDVEILLGKDSLQVLNPTSATDGGVFWNVKLGGGDFILSSKTTFAETIKVELSKQ